jgi:hypothetical protein
MCPLPPVRMSLPRVHASGPILRHRNASCVNTTNSNPTRETVQIGRNCVGAHLLKTRCERLASSRSIQCHKKSLHRVPLTIFLTISDPFPVSPMTFCIDSVALLHDGITPSATFKFVDPCRSCRHH